LKAVSLERLRVGNFWFLRRRWLGGLPEGTLELVFDLREPSFEEGVVI
jgi:hypothetical protein